MTPPTTQPLPSHPQRLIAACWRPVPSWQAYTAATVIALLYLAWLAPLAFLQGNAALFQDGDPAQHISGWWFYATDRWHFPLLFTDRLNHPEGVSIAFTDSIPLAALILKLFAGLLPPHFHYFGGWLIVVFLSQAIGAVFLLRSLGERHMPGALAVAIMLVIAPAILWRLGHTALMTHGLLLVALGLYFRGRQAGCNNNATLVGLFGVTLLGLLIHPYFYAMCLALLCVHLIERIRAGERWQRQLLNLIAFLGFTALLMASLGYGGSSGGAEGFGLYSMNLKTPFCGGKLWACSNLDATGGQYEGFNYLGAGVLLLLVAQVRSLPTTLRNAWTRHPALIVCLTLFTLYALSNRIYFGGTKILSFSLHQYLQHITSIFRAGGRFFWPVAYLIMVIALFGILRRRTLSAALLAIAALTLQWWDLSPYRDRFMDSVSRPAADDLTAWAPLLDGIEQINLHPAFTCGEAEVAQYWFFQRLAAYHGKRFDTGYLARARIDCAAKAAPFNGVLQADQLYILAANQFNSHPLQIPAGLRSAITAGHCATWQKALICRPGATIASIPPLMLASVARFAIPGQLQWLAHELPTNIGSIDNGWLRSTTTSAAGHLSFGPYVQLPAGNYRFTIDYRSTLSSDSIAGQWDAVAAPLAGRKAQKYAGAELVGTSGQMTTLTASLKITADDGPLEIRTTFPGKGDLQLQRITIAPDPENPNWSIDAPI